jgi:hypothetical protein
LALLYTKTSIFSLGLIIYKNQYFFPWPYYIQKPVFFSLDLFIYKNQYFFP